MEDSTSVTPRLEGEENLFDAAQHLVRALGMKKNLTDDEKKVLMDLGIQLFVMSTVKERNEGAGISEIEEGHSKTLALGTKKNVHEEERKVPIDFSTQMSTISRSKGKGRSDIEEWLNLRAIGAKEKPTDAGRKKLVDVGSPLPSTSTLNESLGVGINEIEQQLIVVQEKVMGWEANQSKIWYSSPGKDFEYIAVVDEARKLVESLRVLSLDESRENNHLLQRAHDVLQMVMVRLEEEFRYMLILSRDSFSLVRRSFCSSEGNVMEEYSINSSEGDSFMDLLWGESFSKSSENVIDLVHPDLIPHLKCIANFMFVSNYGQECSQAYICIRKDALDECLFILEMEKLSIEELLRLEWNSWNTKIKRQLKAMKIFVRGYLASEKRLSNQIFGEIGSLSSVSFVEASKVSMLQLLTFGEAIAIGPHQPEKLFRILDMYEVLADLLPDIDALFSDEAGCSVRIKCDGILLRLGYCVRATFLKFENDIASNTSTKPFAGGAIHYLTKYVMNYIKTLIDYNETLNFLLKDCDKGDSISDTSPIAEEENNSGSSSCTMSPIAIHFRSVTDILEANLDEKSNLYRDVSLQHFFLMNNIHYMAQKVKNSELRGVFEDGWIRKLNWKFQQHAIKYERAAWTSILSLFKDDGLRNPGSHSISKTLLKEKIRTFYANWKFQQHAMKYERAAWTSILSLFKDDGLRNPGSHSISKTLLKEKIRTFYAAFEEVYKNQTAWLIPDRELREDLRISTSQMIIQAYRTFVGRHICDISEKYIKYSADDLQNFLLDLYEGSPRSLQNSHRR